MEMAIPIGLLFVLLIVGVPVGFSMAIAGGVGLYMGGGTDQLMTFLSRTPYASTTSYLLSTLPMFILMAEFLSAGTIIRHLFGSANAWLGRLPAGLSIATIWAGAGFGALSGSSTATAASLGRISIPEMRKHGYDDRLSSGSVAIAGTLAVTIPPSIPLIIYGITTETSISDLFAAGVVPGILAALVYSVVVIIWHRINPRIAPPSNDAYTWRDRVTTLRHLGPPLVLVVVVVIGLFTGIFTPTEAGAFGALGALIISTAVGGMRWRGFWEAVTQTAYTTAAIFTIIVGAHIFSQFMVLSGATQTFANALLDADVSRYTVLAIVAVLYLVLGAFMDLIGMLLLTLPVVFPIMMQLGFDPVWLGIVLVLLAEIGLLTPPVGINVFVACKTGDVGVGQGFAGSARFIVGAMLVLGLLVAFPEIATFATT